MNHIVGETSGRDVAVSIGLRRSYCIGLVMMKRDCEVVSWMMKDVCFERGVGRVVAVSG